MLAFLNLTKKSNLIGRPNTDLTQFFDNLVVACFLGHPVVQRGPKDEPLQNHQLIVLKPADEIDRCFA